MAGLFGKLVALGLALVLVLTAETMAMARGASPAVGEITLCTGHGPIDVPVDAEGNVTSGHLCPDCALFFVALLAPVPVVSHDGRMIAAEFRAGAAGYCAVASLPREQARGPPLTL